MLSKCYCFSRHIHSHKMRKYSLQEGARGGGAEGGGERRVSTAPTDEPLPEADQDDLRSHRIEDQKALRRHKFTPRVCICSRQLFS